MKKVKKKKNHLTPKLNNKELKVFEGQLHAYLLTEGTLCTEMGWDHPQAGSRPDSTCTWVCSLLWTGSSNRS